MATIKERAEEYGYVNWQSDDYHEGASEGLYFDPIGHTQKSFEAGANYVLDKIEEFQKLFSTCMNAHANGYLESVIEQLKK